MAVSQFKQLDLRLSISGLFGLLLGTFVFLLIDSVLPGRTAASGLETGLTEDYVRLLLLITCQAGASLLLLRYEIDRQVTAPLRRLAAAIKEGASRSTAGHQHKINLSGAVPDNELRLIAGALEQLIAGDQSLPDGAELKRSSNDQAAVLKRAVAELNSLTHAISHDLRAPVRAIVGFSQALLDDLQDKLPDPSRELLERLTKSSSRLDQMIQDLLQYSRLSRTELRLRKVRVDDCVSAALKALETSIEVTNSSISTSGLNHSVLASPELLEQVLRQLISNSIRFVDRGSRPEITISAEPNGATVRISVSDNGIGIEPAHHNRIFGMFERLNSSDKFEGTGAGLALARLGAERMGGSVGLNSAVKNGAQFWIDLEKAPLE